MNPATAPPAPPPTGPARLYGLLAEFADPTALTHAARATHEAGYRRIEAYSPFPIEDLPAALGHPTTRLPWLIFLGGLVGCIGGYVLQDWAMSVAYPLNVGGRPLHSWPMFIPVTFECTVLAAALTAVLGMLGRNGLPRPHHPLFAVERFSHATRDGFFLCVMALDRQFDREATWKFLAGLNPREIVEVPL
jgi:Protein of unknown function (DUF3341)